MSHPTIHIYTDGSCIGNPGPGGWAWVMVDDENEIVDETGWYHTGDTTNNRMELEAVIDAIHNAPIDSTIYIHTDSLYVINCGEERWKRNKNVDLWEEFDKWNDGVIFIHVKGHDGDKWNEIADKAALRWATRGKELRGLV